MPEVAPLKPLVLATQGWQGGINVRDQLAQLQPNELRRSENVTYDSAGGLSKRPGTSSRGIFGISSDRVLSCYTYYRPNQMPQVLIHTSSGIMLYTTNVTANPILWIQLTTGLSTTQPASFETMNSKVYFAEGTQLGQWDGSGYTQITAAPAGVCFLRSWKDTLWLASLSNPDRVYSSAAGDPTSYPAANYVDILHGDGDAISALASDGLYLIVSKRRRIQVITDPALFVNRTADWEKGSESHNGWIHLEDKLYFLSRLGVCWWQGDSSARLISYKIDPLFDPAVLNFSILSNVWSYRIGARAGWAVPEVGSSYNNLVLEYYPRLGPIYQISGNIGPGPWTMHRMPVSTFTTVRQGTTEAVFGGHPTANKFMNAFDASMGTDDGVTYVSTVEGAPMNLDNPIFTKYFRRMQIVGNGKFTIQLKRNYENGIYLTKSVDFSAFNILWDDGNWNVGDWGPDAIIKEATFAIDAYARVISICVTDSEVNPGSVVMPMGSKDLKLATGAWSLYALIFDAFLLGMRD
jgi:hypothetical protein